MLTNSLYITFHGIGEPAISIEKDEARYFVSEKVYKEIILSLTEIEDTYGIKIHVTFDDGNISDLQCGLPALVDAGRTAAFFVLAGRIDERGYLHSSDLRTLLDAGMMIGTHGYDHVDWRVLDDKGRQREFVEARDRVAQIIGRPVQDIGLPFGRFDRNGLSHLKALLVLSANLDYM
jgi:peptidoglycan/xylan/chitin deacetylase (PgdA/CDA1 family)